MFDGQSLEREPDRRGAGNLLKGLRVRFPVIGYNGGIALPECKVMASVPATPSTETVELCVARLLGIWREQTAYLSSSSRITGHPAYQELIALGPAALPSLFHASNGPRTATCPRR